MTTELVHATLRAALQWMDSVGASGSLRAAGTNPGALFFERGRLYFATVDGKPMSGAELAEADIDRTLWQEASTRPGARLNFVEELIAVGCERASIERFVRRRIEMAVATIGLESGPIQVGKGRHGFGSEISFSPRDVADLGDETDATGDRRATINEDSLVSLATVPAMSDVTVDGRTWNAITALLAPARYAEISQQIGLDSAAALTAELSARGLLTVIESHQPPDPWIESAPSERSPEQPLGEPRPVKASLFDEEPPAGGFDDETDEYVPDRVGRQAYAAMASMRAAASEPAPQEKARALRRLIEAVKGL